MIFRTLLIGCKTLSVEMLHALMRDPHFEVVGVLTKDHWDDMKVWHEMGEISLEKVAWNYGIKIYKNPDINNMEDELTKLNLDYIFSASWPKLLNRRILELPRIGCFNIHVAMLPKNRGCMPIHWAIINNDILLIHPDIVRQFERTGLNNIDFINSCYYQKGIQSEKVGNVEIETINL